MRWHKFVRWVLRLDWKRLMWANLGHLLRHIQELSGHGSLSVLQAYLSCTEKQKRAVALAFG